MAAPDSPAMSARSSWYSRSRRIGRPRTSRRAGTWRPRTRCRWSVTIRRLASAAWTCCAGLGLFRGLVRARDRRVSTHWDRDSRSHDRGTRRHDRKAQAARGPVGVVRYPRQVLSRWPTRSGSASARCADLARTASGGPVKVSCDPQFAPNGGTAREHLLPVSCAGAQPRPTVVRRGLTGVRMRGLWNLMPVTTGAVSFSSSRRAHYSPASVRRLSRRMLLRHRVCPIQCPGRRANSTI